MAEHGPLHLNDDDSISMNPYAWNKKANMIYMEAPIGVGFSKTRVCNSFFRSPKVVSFHKKRTLLRRLFNIDFYI